MMSSSADVGWRSLATTRSASWSDPALTVVQLYQNLAVSTRQISHLTGISRPEVSRLLRGAGIEVAPRGRGRPRPQARLPVPEGLEQALWELYVDRRFTRSQVAEALGLSEGVIRHRLGELRVPMRGRGGSYREDRIEPDPAVVFHLYVERGWNAARVGAELGVSHRVILRTVHEHGWPVRLGGQAPRTGPQEIELIGALYADEQISRALAEWNLPQVSPGGPIWRRFPHPIGVPTGLLKRLYVDCGLSLPQIELLSGQPRATLNGRLRSLGIPTRSPGGRSPFMRRWLAKKTLTPDTRKRS